MEEVIRGLGSIPYFERVMNLRDVWPQCRQLEIPSHFVERHADNIQEFTSIQLRGAGREKCRQWDIRLRMYWQSGTRYRVKISSDTAWRSFMAWSGLQTGDWLIFALTDMSTFEVYMFDNSGNSRVTFSRHQTENIRNISSSISGEGSRSEIFNTGDEVPRPLRKPEWTDELMTRVKQFRCILEGSIDQAVLSVPLDFVRFHGVSLVDTVTFRGESGFHWPVKCSLTIRPGVDGRVECTAGWRSFAEDNELHKGDTLLFNLSTEDSFFVVRMPPTSCSVNCKPCHKPAEQTGTAGAAKKNCIRRPSENLPAVQFSVTMSRSSSLGAPYPFLNIPSGFVQENRSSLAPFVHLRGPTDSGTVKFTSTASRGTGSFSKGWREFVADNEFHIGDEILFTLTGQSCFTVTKQ